MAQQQQDYSWYKRALANEAGLNIPDKPQAGFYRQKSQDKKTWQPVAIWYEGDLLQCTVDGVLISVSRAENQWPWISANPITYALYEAVADRGEPWPDLHPAVTLANNMPPDENSFEGLKARIEDLEREAKVLIEKGAAKTQDEADQATDLASKLTELHGRADRARDAEKRPHIDANNAIQKKWTPLLEAAKIYTDLKQRYVKPFLDAQREKILAEQRKRAAEHQEVATKAAAKGIDLGPEPPPATFVPPPRAGTRGRSSGLQIVKVAKITDYQKALLHFGEAPAVKEAVQKLADTYVKSMGEAPPGCEIDEQTKAT